MIVVADTTPLNYLVLIGHIDLLSALYQRVLIPEAVHNELQKDKTPYEVRAWAAALPQWIEIHTVTPTHNASLVDLDAGEQQAIQLAMDLKVETVLMDESDGRRAAMMNRLKVTGTIAVLERAANLELIDFRAAIHRLEQTNFRLSKSIRDEFLNRNP